MMRHHRRTLIAAASLLIIIASLGVAPAHAQKNSAEVDRLRAEIAKLRAEVAMQRVELDAALREIKQLKSTLRPGDTPSVKDNLYRGQPLPYWQAQLRDADPKFQMEAVEAIGALVRKDPKVLPILIDMLKDSRDHVLPPHLAKQLSAVGAEALPSLIEIAKDSTRPIPRRYAIMAMGGMHAAAKPAVPVLVKALDETSDVGLLRITVTALGTIGPDAKPAIPALVRTLGVVLEDIGKPQTKGSRFGTSLGSLNNKILDVLIELDPALENDLQRPSTFGIKGTARNKAPAQQVGEAWRNVHAALVKRYLPSK